MALIENTVTPLAADLLVCLSEAVQALGEFKPRNISLRPGNQAVIDVATRRDECCEGLAWVRVASIAPSSTNNWPSPDVIPQGGCGVTRLAIVLEMGIVRCAPTKPANQLVSNEEWNALSELLLDDYAAMYRAYCCYAEQHQYDRILLGQWNPLGVDGNCIGGTMNLTVPAHPCNCQPLESPS